MNRGHPVDWIMEALSEIGSFGLVWMAIAAAYALLARRPPVFFATALAVLLAEVSSGTLKELIERDRPFVPEPEPEPIVRMPDTFSFPSGHATVSFACATVLAVVLPRLVVPFAVLAAAIAWSRVVVGVHYPLDVLGGAVLGVVLGLAVTAARVVLRRERLEGVRARALPKLRAGRRRSAPPPPRA